MTTSVDVLAVMDAMVLSAERLAAGEAVTSCAATVEVARTTRAAVAELIEAAEHARRCERFDSDVESWVTYSLRFRESRDRLSSALARVKGA